jgi:hypothetical protein
LVTRRSSALCALVVAAAVFLGGIARVGSAGWGLPYLLHVDEKGFVLWEVASVEWRALRQDDWRPRTTTYGPLLYESAVLLKWACFGGRAHAAEVAARYPDPWSYTMGAFGAEGQSAPFSWAELVYALRVAGALAASLAVLMLALAAWRLEGPVAGAVMAACAAACVGLLQASHYYTTDSLVLVEIALLLHAAARLATGGGLGSSVYAGVVLGAILGTKMSGALLGAVLPVALVYGASWAPRAAPHAWPRWHARLAASRALRWLTVPASPRLLVALGAAVLVYFLICPWPFTAPELYFDVPGNRSGAEVLLSQYRDSSYAFDDWRFTYNDTTPFAYVLAPVLSYALGGPLLGVALLGLARGLSRRRAIDLLALAAFLPTFLLVGPWGVKTIRYALPCVPGLLLAATTLLTDWLARPRASRAARLWMRSAATLALGYTALYGTAFALVFAQPDPRVAASRWLAARVRSGDVVVTEPESPYTAPLGEDADRIGLDASAPFPRGLRIRRLWDQPLAPGAVAAHIDARLAGARYLVIGDFYLRRGLHPAARARAARQAWFYQALLAGETDFVRVATFDSTPRLGPFVFDERDAETLSIDFDHMPVMIFERRGAWSLPFPR